MKSLKGYRIGVLVDYENSDSTSENYAHYADRGKWKEIKEEATDPILKLPIFQHAPRKFDPFKVWWNEKIQHAREEYVTLIIIDVKNRGNNVNNNVWEKNLKRIEEEDFDSGVEDGVKLTTLDSLLDTIRTGTLPLDLWGDDIVRGAGGSIFYKDLFLVAKMDGADEGGANEGAINNDFITQNGGVLLNEQIMESTKENDAMSRLCYVVTDDSAQKANKYINSNPLLVEFSKANEIMFVNTIWARACVDAHEKCDPEEYPILFQPQSWPVQKLCSGDGSRFVISVSTVPGFTGVQHQAIILWLEKLGATYAESLSRENTHLISHHRANECNEAYELGDIHCVSVGWLFHVMQHVYKRCEENKFIVPIQIEILDGSRGERKYLHAQSWNPISSVFNTYASAEGVQRSQCQFLLRGDNITNPDATLRDLGLSNGGTITVVCKITIVLRDVRFLVKRTTRISKVFQAYALFRKGTPVSDLEFFFNGAKIEDFSTTPITLGLGNDDIIEVRVADASTAA